MVEAVVSGLSNDRGWGNRVMVWAWGTGEKRWRKQGRMGSGEDEDFVAEVALLEGYVPPRDRVMTTSRSCGTGEDPGYVDTARRPRLKM